jgi:hypothetical protein
MFVKKLIENLGILFFVFFGNVLSVGQNSMRKSRVKIGGGG